MNASSELLERTLAWREVGRTHRETPLPGESPMVGEVPLVGERPVVRGKFIHIGREKYWVKGVTYGTFRPSPDGHPYPPAARVDEDFARIAGAGLNTVRIYTAPPRWLLDAAHRHGLRVMVGLWWEQNTAFLESRPRAAAAVSRVRADVRECSGHPAIFCYSIGNEITASIVRWHGRRRIESFLRRLHDAVKLEDPRALVTYVNFPTTEYLQLPFLDLFCFNVYLESESALESYLARLHNLAGERPLLLAEIGLDSRRNGELQQSRSLGWQLRSAFSSGCAGAFVFGWTDEWHCGGVDIVDWEFGLTSRDRRPKPALDTVRRVFADLPFPVDVRWPRVSVVVCSFNGARTIRDTLEAARSLAYPDFEVIVVDDGSTDETARIAAEYGVRLIRTANRGLSAARNTGWQEASGDIVAYIDDDAFPDPHWLQYLVHRFMTGDWVGVGGPNIAPPGDGPIADCVANAPGGPNHVMVSDIEAEHIPGCNMAFRRDALAAVGGFDPRFRTAGDDVDLCWRLQELGGRIGFHAGAVDWHHRRNSLAMYWRQQKGYGKAEALLEAKWPGRYNGLGHLRWAGRLYGRGSTPSIPAGRASIYAGVWGSAAYQSLYEPGPVTWLALPLMPEWNLVIGALAVASLLGLSWPPLLWALPLLALAAGAPLVQAALAAHRARFPYPARGSAKRVGRWALVLLLHLMQPLARLIGRLGHGLTPWRTRAVPGFARWSGRRSRWSGKWRSAEAWKESLESRLLGDGAAVRRGGDYDGWDLEVSAGIFGRGRGILAVEEHGSGKQRIRVAWKVRASPLVLACIAALALLAAGAAGDSAWIAASCLAGFAMAWAAMALRALSFVARGWTKAVDGLMRGEADG